MLIRSLIFDVIDDVTYSIKKRTLIKKTSSDMTNMEESDKKGLRMVFLRAYFSMRTVENYDEIKKMLTHTITILIS